MLSSTSKNYQNGMFAAASRKTVVAASEDAFTSKSWKYSLKGADENLPSDLSTMNVFQSTSDGSYSDPTSATAIALAATGTTSEDAFSSKSWKYSLNGAHLAFDPSTIFQSKFEGSYSYPTSATAIASEDTTYEMSTEDYAKLMENKLAPLGKRQFGPFVTTSTTNGTVPQPLSAPAAGIGPSPLSEATSAVSGKKRSAPVATTMTTTKSSSEGGPKNFKVTITENDVLLGRGTRSNLHPGNQRYRRKKEEIRPRYLAAKKKEQKTSMSQELVDFVHSFGGRFLQEDKTTQQWYKVDNETARKKASQALRDENKPEFLAAKRAKYDKRQAN